MLKLDRPLIMCVEVTVRRVFALVKIMRQMANTLCQKLRHQYSPFWNFCLYGEIVGMNGVGDVFYLIVRDCFCFCQR